MTNVVRLSPSRTFLIRQAILNAALKHFPWGVQQFGAPVVLRKITDVYPFGFCFFCEEVVEQYRILTGTYREAPSLETDDCDFTDPDLASIINGAFLP